MKQYFVRTKGWEDNIFKQDNLYHSVGSPRIESLLRDNALYAVWEHNINNRIVYGSCCSRNRNLAVTLSHRSPIQFILDRAKIKQHNRIIPVQSEYQYIKNFMPQSEHKLHQDYTRIHQQLSYSRTTFNNGHQWDEEFVVGLIPDLSNKIKGIIFHHENCSSLRFRELNAIYNQTKQYARTHNIPFAVSKEFLRAINRKQLEWMYERLEEEETLEDINKNKSSKVSKSAPSI